MNKAKTKTEADSLPTPASKLAGDPGFGDDNKKGKGKGNCKSKYGGPSASPQDDGDYESVPNFNGFSVPDFLASEFLTRYS